MGRVVSHHVSGKQQTRAGVGRGRKPTEEKAEFDSCALCGLPGPTGLCCQDLGQEQDECS